MPLGNWSHDAIVYEQKAKLYVEDWEHILMIITPVYPPIMKNESGEKAHHKLCY